MRQPYNIQIYLYHQKNADLQFLLLKRTDDGYWQGPSGGGEDGETPIMAAKRELYEETGIQKELLFSKLDTVSYIPSIVFRGHELWGEETFVVPMYFYGSEYKGEIKISNEHTKYGWFDYDECQKLLYWHHQKTALWELNERLKRGKLVYI